MFKYKDILGKTIQEMKEGDKAAFTKTITESDVSVFCGVVGDYNPLLVNERYARASRYSRRIVPGMLVAGLISNVLGNFLPGPGAIYAAQSMDFKLPVFFGDTITATAEVVKRTVERNRVTISTLCLNQFNEIVLVGEAVLLPVPEKLKTGS